MRDTNRDTTIINRITSAQSDQYIPYSEDLTESPARFFTLTPSSNPDRPACEGWEDVTYYTNRSKHHQAHSTNVDCQWIYILSNPTLPNMLKIGFTKNRPAERVKQINAGTGVPLDFKVEWVFACFNAHDLEKEIHKYLQTMGLRVNKRKEFFYITLDKAKEVITELGKLYKM